MLQVLVIRGRGRWVRGASSADALRGVTSLGELDGTSGAEGLRGTAGGACRGIVGGAGGVKSCFGASVAGGRGAASGCPELSCTQSRACGNAGCTDFTTDGMCDLAAVLVAAVPNPEGEPGRGVAGGAAGEATYDSPTNRGTSSVTTARHAAQSMVWTGRWYRRPAVWDALPCCLDTARGVLLVAQVGGTGGSAGSGGGGGNGPGCGHRWHRRHV